MASMMDLPREGHFNVLLQMLSFLKSKDNGVAVFHPTGPKFNQTQFPTQDQTATPYRLCKQDVPSNGPAPNG